ncbi:Histidine kinase [Seminavis robusta]|uniref:Histidine kinase n=1 Tax=Seminavis robusta TaxID=568900 RepID=A0A9N8DNF5_9STRA|nr:Histidine kinase [Seminavis robusta]|eukprot:Sro176_g077200.1 Histidine kinase (159) ;mRNA; r:4965-5441
MSNQQPQEEQQQQQQVDSTPPPREEDEEEEKSETPPQAYDPERVYTPEQLEVLNVLVHPIWIFDFCDRRMRWANEAGLEMWNASSLEELQNRDFNDISGAAAKRMEDFLVQCDLGLNMTEQWTMYPKGKAVTVHISVSLASGELHPSILPFSVQGLGD